ncbi:MAG: hypothetical protein HXY49_00540 [Ignavibacteriaceae bacterium]|nr:hypothetical protein [Ignavibacteriaceae bacterium]
MFFIGERDDVEGIQSLLINEEKYLDYISSVKVKLAEVDSVNQQSEIIEFSK